MKYLILIVATIAVVCSCKTKQREKAIIDLTTNNDSLNYVIAQRDSVINDALLTISDISLSLDKIKYQEGLIVEAANDIEKSDKLKIADDLRQLSALITTNKRRIKYLENKTSQLRKSNVELNGLVKIMDQLRAQLEQKDKEAIRMMENLDNLQGEVKELNKEVELLNAEKFQLIDNLNLQSDHINQAYYIVGSEKGLLKDSILLKEGAIGRTLIINPNIDKSKLIEIDIRNIDKIDINGIRSEIIGPFTADSYSLEMGDKRRFTKSLTITDKEKFWRNSRILIISYK